MANFDALNRATRDFNNRNVDRFNESTKNNYQLDLNHHNNQTYKQNNNQYSNYYSNHKHN